MPIGLTPGLLQVLGAPAQPARHPPGEPARPASREAAVRPRVEQPARGVETPPPSGARAPAHDAQAGDRATAPYGGVALRGAKPRIDLLV